VTRWMAIAHRAGNELDTLRRAESLGVDLVEADVRLFRGRLEVRHLKTVGPIPLLWDRWAVANPFAERLTLDTLLDRAGAATELMLDLKGRNPRISDLVLRALGDRDIGSVTVCARNWSFLAAFHDQPGVRVVYSVGSRRQLAHLLRRFEPGGQIPGVSIDQRLLTADVAAELRSRSSLLMSWGVEDHPRAHELRGWGVNGIISADRELLSRLVEADGFDPRFGQRSDGNGVSMPSGDPGVGQRRRRHPPAKDRR
jgi:glycerophosphoryl diester phosphodiesterase